MRCGRRLAEKHLHREPDGEHRDLPLPAPLASGRLSVRSIGTPDLPLRTPNYRAFADEGNETR